MTDLWSHDDATGGGSGSGGASTLPPPEHRKPWWPVLLVAGIVLAVAIYTWVSRSGGENDDVLRIGSQRGGTKAVMLASGALEGAPYRVEWSEFPAAQNLLEAIGAGAVDVGMVGDAPFQFAYQSGSPIKAVAAQSAQSRPRASARQAGLHHARLGRALPAAPGLGGEGFEADRRPADLPYSGRCRGRVRHRLDRRLVDLVPL
jgi:hypothetical protein